MMKNTKPFMLLVYLYYFILLHIVKIIRQRIFQQWSDNV